LLQINKKIVSKMKTLTKNTQDVLDLLPATARDISSKLGFSRVTASSCIRVLKAKGLAANGDSLTIPHGEQIVYVRTMKGHEFEDDAPPCIVPKTTLTVWRTALPWEARA
jgi:hypothetical protein